MKEKIIDKVIEVAESLGWICCVEHEGEETTFQFEKYSPAGHDFVFSEKMHKDDVATLIHGIYRYYEDFDVSEETYLYLDSSGHGVNGAPYDMRDLYNDIEASCNDVEKLYDALNDEFKKEEWWEDCL